MRKNFYMQCVIFLIYCFPVCAFRPPYFLRAPSLNIFVEVLLVGIIQTVECGKNCIRLNFQVVCERELKNCSYNKNLRTESPWLRGTQFGEGRYVLNSPALFSVIYKI
jgi:hypothetical protein